MKIDYSLFWKEQFSDLNTLTRTKSWDLLLSAFNQEDRVRDVFSAAQATRKLWAVLPDYRLSDKDIPPGAIRPKEGDELTVVSEILNAAAVTTGISLCIDATGILRQYLVVLIRALQLRGIEHFDILYSEPSRYGAKETTEFSSVDFTEVRQIRGYEGSHSTDTSKDLVIIAAGYEHRLVASISDEKNHASKRLIYAFPSTRPDMFQESALATYNAYESVGRGAYLKPYFAPACDPFVAAAAVRRVREDFYAQQGKVSNLYLAPLSTKPIAIGFALYYLMECGSTPTSVIHPFMGSYANRSAYGLSRIWVYRIELPKIP